MKRITVFFFVMIACLTISAQEKEVTSQNVSTDSIVKPFLFEVDGNEVASSKNLTNVVYIQNQTLTGNNLYEATNIYVGTYVNPQQTQGDVTISSGKTILKANTTYISGTTTVELGAELEITPF